MKGCSRANLVRESILQRQLTEILLLIRHSQENPVLRYPTFVVGVVAALLL